MAKTVVEFKFQMRADAYGDTRGRSLTVPLKSVPENPRQYPLLCLIPHLYFPYVISPKLR